MNAVDTPGPTQELDRLRAALAEWRRRAEVAEAVALERLTRAETAERALAAAEAALRAVGGGTPTAPAGGGSEPEAEQAAERPAPPPRSLRERWRRYVESIN